MRKFTERNFYGFEKWMGIKRRAIKRQLRCMGYDIPEKIIYDLTALRKFRKACLKKGVM